MRRQLAMLVTLVKVQKLLEIVVGLDPSTNLTEVVHGP
jgi:hypothetical protein